MLPPRQLLWAAPSCTHIGELKSDPSFAPARGQEHEGPVCRLRQAGSFRKAMEQTEDNKGLTEVHGRHCRNKSGPAHCLVGEQGVQISFCLGGRKEGGDGCASEEETRVGGVMQQQKSASQGFRVSEWAVITGAVGVHLLRPEKVCR